MYYVWCSLPVYIEKTLSNVNWAIKEQKSSIYGAQDVLDLLMLCVYMSYFLLDLGSERPNVFIYKAIKILGT